MAYHCCHSAIQTFSYLPSAKHNRHRSLHNFGTAWLTYLAALNDPSWSELTYCVSLLTAKNANILRHIIMWM